MTRQDIKMKSTMVNAENLIETREHIGQFKDLRLLLVSRGRSR